jgi:hypothetical protein
VLQTPVLETYVSFCGMVWQRTVVLGRMGWTERAPSKSECSILPTVRHLRAGIQHHPCLISALCRSPGLMSMSFGYRVHRDCEY